MFARLEGHLTGEQETLPYAELGLALGMSEGAVKVAVHRLRRRFGELLREEIAETVSDPGSGGRRDPGAVQGVERGVTNRERCDALRALRSARELALRLSGMCATCLLGLAMVEPEADDPVPDDAGPALVPESAYRVLTILAADDDRHDLPGRAGGHTAARDAPRGPAGAALRRRAAAGIPPACGGLGGWLTRAIPPIIDARRTAAGDGCVVAPYVNGPAGRSLLCLVAS